MNNTITSRLLCAILATTTLASACGDQVPDDRSASVQTSSQPTSRGPGPTTCETMYAKGPLNVRRGPGTSFEKVMTRSPDPIGHFYVGQRGSIMLDDEGREWRPVCPGVWNGSFPDTTQWVAGWLLRQEPPEGVDIPEGRRREIYSAMVKQQDDFYCGGYGQTRDVEAVRMVAKRFGISKQRADEITWEGTQKMWPVPDMPC